MVGVERAPSEADLACRFCGAPLTERMANLGVPPLSNDYVRPGEPETRYPLAAFVCTQCFRAGPRGRARGAHIQRLRVPVVLTLESWLDHVSRYCTAMMERLELDGGSRVVEVGSNDGHLLRGFHERGAYRFWA